jgi:hypothetical protein
MRSSIEQLEESSEHPRNIKNFANLSQRQQKRGIQALGSRAEKVLWFVSHFGLELDSMQFCDKSGKKYLVKTSSSAEHPLPSNNLMSISTCQPPVSQSPDAPPQAPIQPQSSTSVPETSQPSPMNKPWKPYECLSEDDKCKVETLLFLMDKFSVGDAFLHEVSMAIDGMPKSYLVKQCRDKLNSTCKIKPTPGSEPDAQISFKESLANKLRLLVSFYNYIDSRYMIRYHTPLAKLQR